MKNWIVLLGLSLLVLCSCKKNRTCNCTVTSRGLTYTQATSGMLGVDTTIVTPLSVTNTHEYTYTKVTKKQAKSNCISKDDDFVETTQNNVPGIITLNVTDKGTREYDCKLK